VTAAAELDGPQAATRVLRTITTVFGVSGGVFFALTVSQMIAEAEYVSTAWQLAAGIFTFVTPLLLAIVCRWLSFVTLQRALGVYAVGFIIMVATWLPAMTRYPMTLQLSPWPLGATMLGAVAAALAFPPVLAWLALGVNAALVGIVRYLASDGENLDVALQDAVFTVAFVVIFAALAMVAIRGGRAQDAAAALARTNAARAAYAMARTREEARLDALVHDEVMTALYYAAQDRPELATSIRTQAARALTELSRMEGVRPTDLAPVAPAAFVSRMRAVVLGVSPAVRFRTSGERSEPIPADVAAAFAEAAAEAVRNSLAHAGTSGVTRTASIDFEAGTITVAIEDDGAGFDARSVRPHRLGITVSIRARLEAVPGGSASVTSRRGLGTLVLLSWRQP
jgi:hypothetical protein